MRVAVVGWGSLVWDPRELALASGWYPDGPELPVEFARRSCGGRVTLVVTPGRRPVRTYWALSAHERLDDVIDDLTERERAPRHDIGSVPDHRGPGTDGEAAAAVTAWLRRRGDLDGAVWTALPCTFELDGLEQRVVEYLRGLDGPTLRQAREYVERAPPRTVTPVREHVEQVLGWTRRPLPPAP